MPSVLIRASSKWRGQRFIGRDEAMLYAVEHRSRIHAGLTMKNRDNTVRFLTIRVPQDLYDILAADAAKLGTSLADACRFRLRSGSVPMLLRYEKIDAQRP